MPPPKKSFVYARNRILAQRRGVDYAPLETARATPARRPGDILPGLMKELRLDARQAEAELVKVWNSSIDPVVTALNRDGIWLMQHGSLPVDGTARAGPVIP